MKDYGTNLNYAALAISIIKVCSPEAAFEALYSERVKRNKCDVEEFKHLKKQYTFDEIAEMCCISRWMAYHLVHGRCNREPNQKITKKIEKTG